MKAKVLKDFFDAKEEKLRLVGEVFELSPARFDEIIKRGGLWIEEVADDEGDEEKTKETEEEKGTEDKATEETKEEAKEEVEEKPKKKAGAANGGKK
jgi:hypothetical protein